MALDGSYLDRAEFAARSVAPASVVEGEFFDPSGLWTDPAKVARRAAHRTFVDSQLVIMTSRINARLRKRYAVPFSAPVPEIVLGWIVACVTVAVYEKRGWDMSDAQAEALYLARTTALEELKETADSNEGLFDLPIRQDLAASSAITEGGPYAYAEASPYDWIDAQAEAVGK